MVIKRSGSQPSSKGPADWFTGTVRIDPLFEAAAPARVRGARRSAPRGSAHRVRGLSEGGHLGAAALAGIAVVKTAFDLCGDQFQWKNPPYEYEYDKNPFDVIAGTSKVREAIEGGDSLDSIKESWDAPLAEFSKLRGDFLLY
jgi:hypothetical protein